MLFFKPPRGQRVTFKLPDGYTSAQILIDRSGYWGVQSDFAAGEPTTTGTVLFGEDTRHGFRGGVGIHLYGVSRGDQWTPETLGRLLNKHLQVVIPDLEAFLRSDRFAETVAGAPYGERGEWEAVPGAYSHKLIGPLHRSRFGTEARQQLEVRWKATIRRKAPVTATPLSDASNAALDDYIRETDPEAVMAVGWPKARAWLRALSPREQVERWEDYQAMMSAMAQYAED